MDKLLNAIASRLNVRVVVKEERDTNLVNGVVTLSIEFFDYRDVSDEVRELFKKELNNHLFSKLQEAKIGEHVEYGFDYGNVRPLGILMEDVNDNLAEVLLKLPVLNDGERYTFPCDTYVRFTLTDKKDDHFNAKPSMVSPWIMEAYSKQ